MAESKAQLDFHYARREGGGAWGLDGLHNRESRHAIRCQVVDVAALEAGVFTGRVCINKEHMKWRLYQKMVDNVR
jgi:hypothetical protein